MKSYYTQTRTVCVQYISILVKSGFKTGTNLYGQVTMTVLSLPNKTIYLAFYMSAEKC